MPRLVEPAWMAMQEKEATFEESSHRPKLLLRTGASWNGISRHGWCRIFLRAGHQHTVHEVARNGTDPSSCNIVHRNDNSPMIIVQPFTGHRGMFHCALGPAPVHDWSMSIGEQEFGLVQFEQSSSSFMLLGPWHWEVSASVPTIVGLLLLFMAVLWFLRSVEPPGVGRSKHLTTRGEAKPR